MFRNIGTSEIVAILVVTLGMAAFWGGVIWLAIAVYLGRTSFRRR